jgi:DNA-binding NtrC family response regulator
MSKPILIVDDEPAVLKVLTRWLEQEGYDVVTCGRYEDARQYLRNEVPLVLVTDVRLGAYNGLQLAMMLHDRDPDARTLVLSAFDDPTIRHETERIGATFLLKPCARDEFLGLVANRAVVKH